MKKRIATSNLKPCFLQKIYLKAKAVNITRKIIINHGPIVPFRVLPKEGTQRAEVFVLLREKGYTPNHELKLFVS